MITEAREESKQRAARARAADSRMIIAMEVLIEVDYGSNMSESLRRLNSRPDSERETEINNE